MANSILPIICVICGQIFCHENTRCREMDAISRHTPQERPIMPAVFRNNAPRIEAHFATQKRVANSPWPCLSETRICVLPLRAVAAPTRMRQFGNAVTALAVCLLKNLSPSRNPRGLPKMTRSTLSPSRLLECRSWKQSSFKPPASSRYLSGGLTIGGPCCEPAGGRVCGAGGPIGAAVPGNVGAENGAGVLPTGAEPYGAGGVLYGSGVAPYGVGVVSKGAGVVGAYVAGGCESETGGRGVGVATGGYVGCGEYGGGGANPPGGETMPGCTGTIASGASIGEGIAMPGATAPGATPTGATAAGGVAAVCCVSCRSWFARSKSCSVGTITCGCMSNDTVRWSVIRFGTKFSLTKSIGGI
jgi:hypothetical protein